MDFVHQFTFVSQCANFAIFFDFTEWVMQKFCKSSVWPISFLKLTFLKMQYSFITGLLQNPIIFKTNVSQNAV